MREGGAVRKNGRFLGPIEDRSARYGHLQIMWVRTDVCRLLSINLGCWQNNVGLRPPILSINLGRKSRSLQVGAPMFAGPNSYYQVHLDLDLFGEECNPPSAQITH